MDPTERRLRAAVLAAPDDDVARLQYADWAVSVGDPRGEFIRTQLALMGAKSSSLRMALRAKERRLLKANRAKWMAASSKVGWKSGFDRGFLGWIQVNPKGFAGLRELLAEEPITELVLPLLKGKREQFAAALALPGIARVQALKLAGYGGLAAEDLRLVVEAFTGLRRLNLGNVGVTAKLAKTLSEAPAMAGLRRLSLSGNHEIDDKVVEIFLSEGCVFSLEALHLSRTKVTGRIAEILARWRGLAGMKYLSLGNTTFDDDSAAVMAQTAEFAGLRMLDLMETSLTGKGALLLAGSENLGAMMRLDLRRTDAIGDPAVRATLRARFGSAVRFDRHLPGTTEVDGDEEDLGGDAGDEDEDLDE